MYYVCLSPLSKKGLETSKRYTEVINQRTDNIMVKRKKDKRTNNDLQNAIASHQISYRYSCKLW